jgi:glycosyltransferase involved in cell wall biosynthesis
MEARLRRIAPEGVTFLGSVSHREKLSLLARADVLMVTSVREGWGLVVTEAGRMGTPAVGYDVGGLRDSIRAQRTGVLVDQSPRAMADACVDLLRDANRLEELGHEALNFGRQFDWDKSAVAVLRHLDEVVRGPCEQDRIRTPT